MKTYRRGNKKPSLLIITGMLISILCAILSLHALDETVKKMLRKATGISDEDVKSASGKKEITLFDAYALAVRNTERLAIEGENSIQAEERKLQAIESFLPYFSIRGNYALTRPDTKYINIVRSTASLYLRQPIITGLKEASLIKASMSDRKIKEYQLYNNSGLLLSDVGNAYFNVLLIERDLYNNEQLLDLYTKTVGELKRRVNIGRSRQSEILRTNAQIYSLQANIKSLRTNLEHAKLVLATLTGTNAEFTPVDSGNLNDPEYAIGDAAKLVESRWDVKAAKEQMEYAESGVLAAYSLHLPSAYLEGSYILPHPQEALSRSSRWERALQAQLSTNPGASILSGMLNNGFPTKTRDYYFSLGAEMPIFGGDITFAKVREANSVKRQYDLNYSQTVRVARQDIIDSFQTWESSKIEVEAYLKALKSAEENYRVVAGEYRLNLVTILDVLTTLTSLQSAKEDYERAILQVKLNRIRLGIAINEFTGDNIRVLKRSYDKSMNDN
jgi:outer membrane protein TolC